MKDIKRLCTSFDKIGIEYTIRQSGEYEYVFIGRCKNIHHMNLTFETSELGQLLISHNFFEFKNGELTRYSNS